MKKNWLLFYIVIKIKEKRRAKIRSAFPHSRQNKKAVDLHR
jgi:hypothetical protein